MPVNLDKRALWMKAISLGSSTTFECNSEEVGSMHVCAKHFDSKYVTEKFRLLNTACPTLFTDEEISSGIPFISYPEIDILGINCDHTYFASLHCDHNYAKPHHKSRATDGNGMKRCVNMWDDGCINGQLGGSGSDDYYLGGSFNPGKRCVNMWDEGCINGQLGGSGGDDYYLNGGFNPGKRCVNMWDEGCINGQLGGSGGDDYYLNGAFNPGRM